MDKVFSIQKIIKNIQMFSIFTLTIGIFTQGMYSLPIFPTMLINIPCVLLIFTAFFSKEKIFVINKYNALYYLFSIYMIIGEMFQSRENAISYIIYFFSGIILMNTIRVLSKKEKNSIINLYKGFCILAASITLLSIFVKDFYFNNFLPLLYPNNYIIRIYNFYKTGAYSGPFVQIGTNAFFMGIGIVIIVSQILNNLVRKKKTKIVNYIFLIILTAVLLLTKKRGMLLYTFFVSLFMLFFVLIKLGSKGMVKILKFSIPAIIVIGVIVLTNESLLAVFDRFQKEEDFLSGREQLYSYAIDMFEEKTIFGHGLKSFKEKYDLENNLEEKVDAHNVFLQLLAEEGIVGTTIYLLQLFYILISTMRLLTNRVTNKKDIIMQNISLTTQLIFIMYFISGNALYDTFILFTYFIFVMIGFYKEESYEKNRNFNIS